MHGVREVLLDEQAAAIGIPLIKMYVNGTSNEEYEQNMENILLEARSEGIEHIIFGDIFLDDLRSYREKNLMRVKMTAVFPLWKRNTKELIDLFLSLNFKTVTCCVNDAHLGRDQVGEEMNSEFVDALPAGVDPCGENGEFHTFCFDGPLFKHRVNYSLGEKIYKPLELKTDDSVCGSASATKGFWYCDLIPA
jgi:uncharacterized protein (TIGR00290 family)